MMGRFNRHRYFTVTTLFMMTCLISGGVSAACIATVNGLPMGAEECALSIEIYGQVVPGACLMDSNGNWVNANNPMHRGNIYACADSETVHSRYGSGQIDRDGSWSHCNNLTEKGGVAGWNQGGKECYYAFGWSNC